MSDWKIIMGKKRQSNIELLRIISMILILAHHFSLHGGFEVLESSLSLNRFWIQFLQLGGKIGVDIFIIISGYFLIYSQKIKLSKVLKLWFQLFFYSVLIYIIFILTGVETISMNGIIKNIFPVIFTRWWFASTYFVLYLLSPYLNKLLISLSKVEYQKLLIVLTFFWCIIPTFTAANFQSNVLIWFIYLYTLAGYIRLYGILKYLSNKWLIIVAIVSYLATYLSAVIFDILGTKIFVFSTHSTYFFGMQKLPILMISVFIFLIFLRVNIGSIKLINIISSATFGVYLIHDNEYVREFLWHTLFKNVSHATSNNLISYSILVIILVYIACTIIELLRIYLIEKNYMLWVNNISVKTEEKINNLIEVVCNKL